FADDSDVRRCRITSGGNRNSGATKMANTDAWRAPEGADIARRKGGRGHGLAGNARIIAEPAYGRLLAAESILKRSIPTLIIIFLVVVAAARSLSLASWHEEVERNARTVLGLATADLVRALTLAEKADD